MINSEYLNNLNKSQKEAVLHLSGPLLIVAGAGSGKTKVLTSRIAHIIKFMIYNLSDFIYFIKMINKKIINFCNFSKYYIFHEVFSCFIMIIYK